MKGNVEELWTPHKHVLGLQKVGDFNKILKLIVGIIHEDINYMYV